MSECRRRLIHRVRRGSRRCPLCRHRGSERRLRSAWSNLNTQKFQHLTSDLRSELGASKAGRVLHGNSRWLLPHPPKHCSGFVESQACFDDAARALTSSVEEPGKAPDYGRQARIAPRRHHASCRVSTGHTSLWSGHRSAPGVRLRPDLRHLVPAHLRLLHLSSSATGTANSEPTSTALSKLSEHESSRLPLSQCSAGFITTTGERHERCAPHPRRRSTEVARRLVDGRWSLVDYIDTDGKVMVLAVRSEPARAVLFRRARSAPGKRAALAQRVVQP